MSKKYSTFAAKSRKDQDARLLFRTADGKFTKSYVTDYPVWVREILKSIQ